MPRDVKDVEMTLLDKPLRHKWLSRIEGDFRLVCGKDDLQEPYVGYDWLGRGAGEAWTPCPVCWSDYV